jgi:hypothetical protein
LRIDSHIDDPAVINISAAYASTFSIFAIIRFVRAMIVGAPGPRIADGQFLEFTAATKH